MSGMSTVTPRASTRLGRLAAIVLVFAILGPPIGTVVFMLTLVLRDLATNVDMPGLSWFGLFAIYAVPFGYLIGVWPAAMAGLLLGLWQIFKGPAPWWGAVVVGVLVGPGFLVATGQPILHPAEAGVARDPTLLMTVTCVGATLACWGIVRGWHFAARQGEVSS